MPIHQTQSTNGSNSSNANTATHTDVSEEQELLGNQQIIEIIRQQNNPTGQRAMNPNKNGIVLLGMNTYAHDESAALNRYNPGQGARSALPNQKQDHITSDGVEYNLTTLEGTAHYIATLGLPDQKAVHVAELLLHAGEEAKDELAQFIKILSEAEMGERKIDRMVLSGHSVGGQIWGDDNGEISFEELEDLAKIFPKAMGQVQHLFMSACYSGGETGMERYRGMFENVDSIWAYHDSSPGTWTGAMDHMEIWEQMTEPGKAASGIDPELATGMAKSKNVSTWNGTDGYQGGQPMSVWDIENYLRREESMYQSYFQAQQLVTDPHSGPLREYYGYVQRAINHPDTSSALRTQMQHRRDVTIRLLYFTLISSKFNHHYHGVLKNDYENAELELPDFTTMNRQEILLHIEENSSALAGTEALRLLQEGLRDLHPNTIPTSWV